LPLPHQRLDNDDELRKAASKTLNQRLAQWLIGPELKEMTPTWRPSLKFSFWTKEILEFNAVLIEPVQELLS